VSIDLQLQNVDEDFRFNNLAELALFRVLKELISNTLKHAGASNIIIKFTQRRKMFLVEYFDDGVGFDFKTSLKKKGSLGLKNIVNRIGTVGGSIRFSTTADGGSMTLIEVSTEENTFHSGGITDV
jgi:signal transduction histidine kinase